VALNTFWTRPSEPPTFSRPRRWQLLVMDALDFYKHRPGGVTAAMVEAYVRPRLGWFGRTFGCQPKVYAVIYSLVDRGWIDAARGEAVGEHGGYRYTYRISKTPVPALYEDPDDGK